MPHLPSLVSTLAAEATLPSCLSSLSRSLPEGRWLASVLFAQASGLWPLELNGFGSFAPCFFRLGVGGVRMAAPLLPRRRLGYFRWIQCFRVGAAVAFPTVVASASQSSAELEQVRGEAPGLPGWGAGLGRARPRGAGLAWFPAWEGLNGPLISLSPSAESLLCLSLFWHRWLYFFD